MTTLNAARDLGTTKKRAANEAPKHHAKKAKTSISVAGLFAKKPRTVREGLQPTDGTSRKHRSVEDELTAKARRHPIYLDVKGVRLRASTLVGGAVAGFDTEMHAVAGSRAGGGW